MINHRIQQPKLLFEFAERIQNEEKAIAHEIKKYKLNYQNKVLQPSNIEQYVRISRELELLVTSYCKNIVYVAPNKLSNILEEITFLFDQNITRYHELFLKYHEKFQESCKTENKTSNQTEICSVCSMQMNKVNIARIKNCILNQTDPNHIEQYNDQNSKDDQNDLLFFSEVNNMLTNKQGEILKKQIEINKYQDIALNALNSLVSVKNLFNRDSLVLPNFDWINQAKIQMQLSLKMTFKDKIPPWILKMFNLFWNIYSKEIQNRREERGVQTNISTESEILQLKKRVLIEKQKLHKIEHHSQSNQRQLNYLNGQKKDLEIKVDYYKKQLNKLVQEIQNLKTENQIIKMKLSNSRLNLNYQANELEKHSTFDFGPDPMRQNTIATAKTERKKTKKQNETISDQKFLPKIKKTPQTKKELSSSRPSIKMNLSSQSHQRGQKKPHKERAEKISGFSLVNNNENENINNSHIILKNLTNSDNNNQVKQIKENKQNKENSQNLLTVQFRQTKGSRSHIQDHFMTTNVIKEEQGQTNLQDQKRRIKEVNDHLKQIVKTEILHRNSQKNHLSSTIPIPKLKRVTRKTNQQSCQISQRDKNEQEANSLEENIANSLEKNIASSFQHAKISKIYHYLKESGYLIKITESQFQKSMIKIKAFNFSKPKNKLKTNAHSIQKVPKTHHQKMIKEKYIMTKRSWNQQMFHPQYRFTNKDRSQISHHQSSDLYSIANDYMVIFTSLQNAYYYESSLTKNHLKGVNKLTKIEETMCEDIFQKITDIKVFNNDHYQLICSFFRCPYQVLHDHLGVLNFITEMNFTTFKYYFQRILGIHSKCKKPNGICVHLEQFKKKLFQNQQQFRHKQ